MKKAFLILLLSVSVVLTLCCASKKKSTNPDAKKSDFTIKVNPQTQWVMGGESAEYRIKLTSLDGFSAPCTLSVAGLAEGDSAKFNSKMVVPTDSAKVTIFASASTPADSYALVITGKNGELIHSDTVLLVLGISDFALQISPRTQSVMPGGSVEYLIELTSLNGFSAPCTLSVVGFPEKDSIAFDSKVIVPPDSSRLSIYTTFSTPRDTYSLVITGKNGEISHNDTVTLVVPLEKATDYYPLAIGNSWTYVLLGPDGRIWDTFSLTIIDTATINSNFGYLFSAVDFIYVAGDTIFSRSPGMMKGMIVLLGPLVIGQSWIANSWNYELIEFGATTLANGTEYSNCIKFKKTDPAYPRVWEYEWWAKDVGRVKWDTYAYGQYQGSWELVSFTHP
jgi:hypothetical protein